MTNLAPALAQLDFVPALFLVAIVGACVLGCVCVGMWLMWVWQKVRGGA